MYARLNNWAFSQKKLLKEICRSCVIYILVKHKHTKFDPEFLLNLTFYILTHVGPFLVGMASLRIFFVTIFRYNFSLQFFARKISHRFLMSESSVGRRRRTLPTTRRIFLDGYFYRCIF